MERIDDQGSLFPPALVAKIEAAAAAERRPAREVVREAVELYLHDRRPGTGKVAADAPRTPLQAATRMLERRRHHSLPAGMSIRELMTHGRA